MQDFHRLLASLYSDRSRQICESRREDWRWQTISQCTERMPFCCVCLWCVWSVFYLREVRVGDISRRQLRALESLNSYLLS